MRSKVPQLTLAVASALSVVALSLLPDSSVVARTVVALPLAVLLPGYAVITAAFSRDALGTTERITLSLGLSLALGVVGGVILNWTPWGLRAGSWIVLLGGITVGACFYALARPLAAAPGDEGRAGVVARAALPELGDGSPARLVRDGVLLTLAAGIAVAAGWVAIDGARVRREGFSQLWMLPLDGDRSVQVGLRSEELASTEYTLRLVADDSAVLRTERLRLEPGDQWEATVPVTADGTVSKVEAQLYRADDPTRPYRRVLLRPGGASARADATS
jgi:uncharacterized membrane protein